MVVIKTKARWYMKIRILFGMIFSAALMALSGCGGGGGDGTPVTPATPTVVSGVAAKGQFTIGKVDIYGVDSVTSGKGTLLKTTSLDALGAYTADIGSYQGPILIEVSGSYKDEATGTTMVVAPTTPLRVAISNAAGNVSAMVTPLTEMAVKKMNNVFTKTAVDTINGNIATTFKVEDITKTKPVDATNAASATATAAERNQSLVLAAISQMVKNSGGNLDDVLKGMADDITGSTLADKSIAAFKTAMFDFMSDPAKNKTGITDPGNSLIHLFPFKLAHLKISTAGLVDPAAKIGGIDFTFNLPTGVTLTKDAISNKVSPGVVVVSGVAAAAGTTSISLATLNLQALRTVLANGQGFGVGEFVDISCTIPATVTTSVADLKTAFTTAITSATVSATDLAGAPIPAVSLTAVVDVF
jgi:hypothetical protein